MKTCLLITTFNRSHLLEKSLERLTHLTLPDSILVVDDGSKDATKEVCNGFKERLPIKYIYNHNPQWSICSLARNIGIKNTDADIIITSEPELLWISDCIPQMLKQSQEHPMDIVSIGTIYHTQSERTPIRDLIYTDPEKFLKESIVENYQTEPRPYNVEGFCKTVNMQATFACLYKRDWLIEIGGWDESFPGAWGVDDWDLCTRLRIKGHGQVIDSSLSAVHLWHPHLPPHLMGAGMKENEEHMKAKQLSKDGYEDPNNPNLIANLGREYGIIIPRPNE